mmetsp:Transcript_69668/g.194742  ORF Transcript_69668/g.194742 Transcript_69668/m.194742 type:complete len:248 (-) Transcript_69668:541-1284(-)
MGKRRQRLSDDRGLVLELVDKGRDVLHNDTGRTRRRVVHLHHLDARREVHAQRGGVDGLDLLFLGLHDVGQLGVPRLVQTKVRRHHQRGAHLDHLGPVVRLTLGGDAAVRERELGGHGGLRPAEHGGEHGTSLRTVAVDRLLAEQNDIRCLLLDDLLQQLRHCTRENGRRARYEPSATFVQGKNGRTGERTNERTDGRTAEERGAAVGEVGGGFAKEGVCGVWWWVHALRSHATARRGGVFRVWASW